MTYSDYSEKLNRLRYLADKKQTGTPDELARKLGVSTRTMYRMVSHLRNVGATITYNRFRRTYEL